MNENEIEKTVSTETSEEKVSTETNEEEAKKLSGKQLGKQAYEASMAELDAKEKELIEKLSLPSSAPKALEPVGDIYFDLVHNRKLIYSQETKGSFFDAGICYKNQDPWPSAVRLLKDRSFINFSEVYTSFSPFSIEGYTPDSLRGLELILDKERPTGGSEMLILMPDSVDQFDRKIREKCRGYFIVPSSIAATYSLLRGENKIEEDTRVFVFDFDTSEAYCVETEVRFVEKDAKTSIEVTRYGYRECDKNNHFNYVDASNYYLERYCAKNGLAELSPEALQRACDLRLVEKLARTHETQILNCELGLLAIDYDEELFTEVLNRIGDAFGKAKEYVKNSLSMYMDASAVAGKMFLCVSNLGAALEMDSERFLSSETQLESLKMIRDRKRKKLSLWFEYLPRLSLEIKDAKTGMPRFVALIQEDKQKQEVLASLDSERVFPVEATITLPAYQDEIHLPMDRMIFGRNSKPKKATFSNGNGISCFPLQEDVKCRLKVLYRYDRDDPFILQLTPIAGDAEPPFTELNCVWEEAEIAKPKFSEIEARGKALSSGEIDKVIDDLKKQNDAMERAINGSKADRKLFFEEKNQMSVALFNQYTTVGKFRTRFNHLCTPITYRANPKKAAPFYKNPLSSKLVKTLECCLKLSEIWKGKKEYKLLAISTKRYLSYFCSVPLVSSDNKQTQKTLDRICNLMIDTSDTDNVASQFDYQLPFFRLVTKDTDKWGILDSFSKRLVDAGKNDYVVTSFLRSMSGSCWDNPAWIYDFYETEYGQRAIDLLIKVATDEITDMAAKLRVGQKVYGAKARDIFEPLLYFVKLRKVNASLFDPNENSIKRLIWDIEFIAHEFETKKPEDIFSRNQMGHLSEYKPRLVIKDSDSASSLASTVYALRDAIRGTKAINLTYDDR